MKRKDVERWFDHHPEASARPGTLLDRCESEIRLHANQEAWGRAREIMEGRLAYFEQSFGLPASDAFVAREVCHEVAKELRRREPQVPEGSELAWVSESLLATLSPGARVTLGEWLHDLARDEEHAAWLEVVRFTDRFSRQLIRNGMSNELHWDFDHSYTKNAARVARLLLREYEDHERDFGPESA